MATRLIGTDDADPRLPPLVIAATQGTTSADLAPGDILGVAATWTTPFTSGVTVGSGTVTANWYQAGPLVHCHAAFVLGAGSAVTGEVTVTLPVTAAAATGIGVGRLLDFSFGSYTAVASMNSTTTAIVRAVTTSATYGALAALSATIPFTWTSTDAIYLSLTYLAAP